MDKKGPLFWDWYESEISGDRSQGGKERKKKGVWGEESRVAEPKPFTAHRYNKAYLSERERANWT